MKFRVFTCITLLCYGLSSSGQTKGEATRAYTVNGLVSDTDTRQPISGAKVQVGTSSAVTSAEGKFTINSVSKDKALVIVQAPGYDSFQQQVRLRQSEKLNISLHRQDIKLNEVEITGHRSAVPTSNATSTISGAELDRTRGGNLAEAIKAISGVNMLQTGSTIAKPVIQGLHSNRILTLNNGIRQESQQWGSEHAPEIDPFIARQITVIKGAEAIRYGAEAIGGVVLVEPPALPHSSEIKAELNLTGASNGRLGAVSGMLSGGLPRFPGFGWRIQGTARQAGNVKSANYYLENSGMKEINFSAAVGYNTEHLETEVYYSHFQTELGIFKGAHFGNLDDLQDRIAYGRPLFDGSFTYNLEAPLQKVSHDLLKLKSHFHLANGASVNAIYGFQSNNRQEYDLRRVLNATPSLNLKLQSHTLDLNIENMSESGLKTIFGLNGLMQVNNNVPGTGITPMIPNYDSYGGGAYGLAKLFRRNYELELGLRYDYRNLDALGYNREGTLYGDKHNFHNVSVSAGGVLHVNNHFHLRSNLGTAWRPPVGNELYSDGLHHGTGSYERGDASLKSERALKWINSVEFHSGKFSLNADAYLNYIYDYIYLSPGDSYFENIRGTFPIYNYGQTNARFMGIDMTTSYKILPFAKYELKGSLVRAKDIRNDLYLPWIPSDRVDNSILFNLPSFSKLSNNYIKLQHQYVAEQTRYDEGSDFTASPPAYHLLNLDAGFQVKAGKNKLSVNFSINNLTNKLYKEYMNRFRYYAHDTGRNFILRATYRI
ncbi:iron complex outermembrane receptor protein [Arcticibacter pallidicorallinus]|uniref:Iron complex outermembrane receptor protein n=1 Tax=Arcticibacter pallidicorallinus TaxID=1259464 RepID=A0A2T0TV51_9SPHI|nr:TonB-dependent receptor [Arcticibacter pallidicorallinus]PRY49541.1 iron complex outermembrane receptor protein [Arcticibacter pallidicorallinus]